MATTKKTANRASGRDTSSEVWTDEERAAMQEHAKDMKAKRGSAGKKDGEADALAKIAEMPQPDRGMAERIHAIVKANAPDLLPSTWYGMPSYTKDGKAVCFFQPASKFKARYSTFGFNDNASLDDGTMWPTSYALTKLTAADEATIAALVKKAAG
ncbi:MAG TPA: DUF1801 domain-containing protein [Candidatus Limnocylindria bacterium]|jgi:uncharacterized protein YdhG (YjbR/CyaY superfamily)